MTEQKANWITIKPEEVKAKIIELAKQGVPAEKIGLILRDQHGIPKVKLLGLKVGHVLKEAKLWKDSEENNIARRAENLKAHAEKHKHDYNAKKSLAKKTAHINILKRKENRIQRSKSP